MKKIFSIALFLAIVTLSNAQIPEKFNYQGILRNSSDELIENTNVSIQISLLEGSASGSTVYVETHNVQTNNYGQFDIQIGNGTIVNGDFLAIDWASGQVYLKTEVDESGGSSFTELGVVQLVTVPYAIYAKNVENKDDADADPLNEIQTLSFIGDSLEISDGNKVVFPYDSSNWVMNGNTMYYNGGNVGIGSSAPVSNLEVKANIAGSEALFQVINANNDTVFAVYPDGVKVFIDPEAKGRVGGFAISGRSPSKAGVVDYMRVTTDSTRIYVNEPVSRKGRVGGFAISGRSPSKGIVNDYLIVTNDSTRIYINDTSTVKGRVGGFAISGRSPSKGIEKDYFNISSSSSADIIDPAEPRVLWYPTKEAFLVGKVLVESPDSVGTNSFVTGHESKAIGNYSQALGYSAIARGNYSTAIGNNSIAGANNKVINAFAFGNKVYALDTNSVAIGRQVVASSKNAIAIGDSAVASGINAIAFGSSFVDFTYFNGEVWDTLQTSGPIAKGNNSLAIGSGVVAISNGAVVIGALDTAFSEFTTVFGFRNKASAFASAIGGGERNATSGRWSTVSGGHQNMAFGEFSTVGGGETNDASGKYATIGGGVFNIASGDYSTVAGGRGNHATNDYANVLGGYYGTASGARSTVISGYWTEAHDYFELAFGQYPVVSTGNQDSWVNTDRLLTIGNGTGFGSRSNALVMLKNGNTGIGTSTPGSYKLYVNGGNAYFSNDISASNVIDRTPYPKDLETAYKAVLSMSRLPDGEYEENNKENQLDHSTLHPFVQSSDGKHRNLSATVSAQNEVIKDLIKQIEELKKQVEELSKVVVKSE